MKIISFLIVSSFSISSFAGTCTAKITEDGLRTETVPMIQSFQKALLEKGYQAVKSGAADVELKIGVKYTGLDGKDVTSEVAMQALQSNKNEIQGFVSVVLKYNSSNEATESKTFAAQSGSVDLINFVNRLFFTMIAANYSPDSLKKLVLAKELDPKMEEKLNQAREDKEVVDQLVSLGARTIEQIPDCTQ